MVLWIIYGYLALAVIFYMVLTATAADVGAAPSKAHKWLRARKLPNLSLLRRLPRLPKRPH